MVKYFLILNKYRGILGLKDEGFLIWILVFLYLLFFLIYGIKILSVYELIWKWKVLRNYICYFLKEIEKLWYL